MGERSKRVEFHRDQVTLVGDLWESSAPLGVVMLLHGGGQTRHSWYRTGQRLGAAGWTVLSMDSRGHGESSWAPDGNYSMDALVADLRFVAGRLDQPPVMVGASMGGSTALVGQGEHPELAKALVLVDIVPRVEPAGVARIHEFMKSRPDGFASLEEVAAAVHAYNPHRRRAPTAAGLRKNVRQREDGRWYWHWDPAFLLGGDEPARAERTERLAAAARAVRVPTLLVRGMQSDIVSDRGVAELKEMILQARFVEVSDAGHMVAGDENDVFTANLIDFLESVQDR
jgi:pimeloyl-ACP methyl ester carboxylesterase